MLKLCVNPTAAVRLAEARRFVEGFLPSREIPHRRRHTRGSRRVHAEPGDGRSGARARASHVRRSSAHAVSTAVRLATPVLAGRRLTPATGLALQAVITRAAHEAATFGELSYLHAIAGCPGFPRAALSTLSELRHALVGPEIVERSRHPGCDLSRLAHRFEADLQDAGLVDRASVIESAIGVLTDSVGPIRSARAGRMVLLDVAVGSSLDAAFVRALARSAGFRPATRKAG